jgi:uncharacterized protein (TIGR03437 family)
MLTEFCKILSVGAVLAITVPAQSPTTYTVSTFAGTGPVGSEESRTRGDGGPASEARVGTPLFLHIDSRGGMYVMAFDAQKGYVVRRIGPDGIINAVGYYPTFPMTNRPNGNLLYMSSWGLGELDPSGVQLEKTIEIPRISNGASSIATNQKGDLFLLAGGVLLLEAGDDRYRTLSFPPIINPTRPSPSGMIAIGPGDRIYAFSSSGIFRSDDNRSFTQLVPRFCDGSRYYFGEAPCFETSVDGPAGTASVGDLQSAVFDSKGNAYFTEYSLKSQGCKVRMMAPDLSVRTIAGGETCSYQGDGGPGLQARFMRPGGITIDSDGNLYVADTDANRIRKLTPNLPAGAAPRITAVSQAASYQTDALAPGSIFTLFGENVGPATLTTMQVTNGKAATNLGGVRVLFDGVPAPLLYVAATQVSGVVPLSLGGTTSVQVQVEYRNTRSSAHYVGLAPAKPGLFTAGGSGKGSAAAANQDGTINSAAQPAPAGSVAVLYGTGFGSLAKALEDGVVVTGADATQLPVAAKIGGLDADVLYAGAAPGMIAGVVQINVRVPAGLEPGSSEVLLQVGPATTPKGVTLAVR